MYAIEVEFEPGFFMYVVDNDLKPRLYENREAAEIDASIWNSDRVKVTEYVED